MRKKKGIMMKKGKFMMLIEHLDRKIEEGEKK
jgi:hypothetical protein